MTPPFPFSSLTGDHRGLGLALGVALGVAFGFVLERAGLGRVQKLAGLFLGRDMTVLRVLFTGLVTAMLGAMALAGAGLLDASVIELRYPTYLWPMIAGGLALGAGFAVSGYCPGTCVVAAASGKLDALAALGGIALGGLLYAELEAALGAFPGAGALGAATLPRWLGLPAPLTAAGVAALALTAFAIAGRVERHLGGRAGGARAAAPPREERVTPVRPGAALSP